MATLAEGAPGHRLEFEVREGLNINRFIREGQVAAHLLLRSGERPRILIAFPAGNSGVGVWFSHQDKRSTWLLRGQPRTIVSTDGKGRPLRGLVAEAQIAAQELRIAGAVLSSVRVLRDYQALGAAPKEVAASPIARGNTITWSRDRLDGAAGYRLTLEVVDGDLHEGRITAGADGMIGLRIAGVTGETPLTPLSGEDLLNESAMLDDATRDATRNTLSFLSYREKFLAGSWRFNTYFGRDTLMSVRLLMPVLSPAAIDAGLGAVLARLSARGEVAHEEDIGEFAILDHLKHEQSISAEPVFDYKMIDGSFMLGPVSAAWLLDDARGRQHAVSFLSGRSGGDPRRRGEGLVGNLRFVLKSALAFARDPQFSHLIGLQPGRTVGEWRDSDEGIGRGRYPYDVNGVLVPAALRAAGRFHTSGLLDPYLTADDRLLFSQAADMANVWQEQAPGMFDVRIAPAAAVEAVEIYAASLGISDRPGSMALGAAEVRFHAISLDALGAPVPIMNSDEGFELLFGAPDGDSLDRAVTVLMRPFPAGLLTDVGMVVANPVFAPPEVQRRFSRNAYHGTVIWSWQQALYAAGLERQSQREDLASQTRAHLLEAQKALWSVISATRTMNNSELWSWSYAGGRYAVAPFGAAAHDADESNAAQLWSTVYLAVREPQWH